MHAYKHRRKLGSGSSVNREESGKNTQRKNTNTHSHRVKYRDRDSCCSISDIVWNRLHACTQAHTHNNNVNARARSPTTITPRNETVDISTKNAFQVHTSENKNTSPLYVCHRCVLLNVYRVYTVIWGNLRRWMIKIFELLLHTKHEIHRET